MEELINWLNTNKDIIISNQTPNLLTLKWEKNGAGFLLSIYKKDTGVYRCSGKIHVKDCCKDEVIESTIWKIVNSEKEVVNLLEGMISSSLDLKKFMRNKHDYLNWGISK